MGLILQTRRFVFHLLLSLAVLAAASGSASAQSIYGSVRGLLTDTTGAVIPGAKVTLINQGTNAARSTTSSALGEYVFSDVIPGTYTIAVEAAGFKKLERKDVGITT